MDQMEFTLNRKLRSLTRSLMVLGLSSIGGFAKGRTGFTRAPGGGAAGDTVYMYSSDGATRKDYSCWLTGTTDTGTGHGATWVTLKHIVLADMLSTTTPKSLVISYDAQAGDLSSYSNIFRGDTAVGTQRTLAQTFTTYKETVTGWSEADALKIKGRPSDNYTWVQVKNLILIERFDKSDPAGCITVTVA